jgi:hypothetical protein
LRDQQDGGDSHRHERPLARPKRNRDGDVGDEPTYVDGENNNILSKAEYEALLGNVEGRESNTESQLMGNAAHPTSEKGQIAGHTEDIRNSKELLAGIGERKKRQAGKAVGVDLQNNESAEADKPQLGKAKSTNKPKKAKKVKLSFEGDEGGEEEKKR